MSTLAETLGITADNREFNRVALAELLDQPPGPVVNIDNWFEAPYCGMVLFDFYITRWEHREDYKTTGPSFVELFSGAFWRTAGWGRFTPLGLCWPESSPELREFCEDPAWVVRDICGAWSLATVGYVGGLLGRVTHEEGKRHVLLQLDAKEKLEWKTTS